MWLKIRSMYVPAFKKTKKNFLGCVDPSEDYLNKVIEPVRKAVIVLANLIGQHRGGLINKSASLHNSLPVSIDHVVTLLVHEKFTVRLFMLMFNQ